MSIGQEIKFYVPAIYNTVFFEEQSIDCYEACEDGKCICMDTEQEELLRKLISEKSILIMGFEGENIRIRNMEYFPMQELICQLPKGSKCSNGFFKCTHKFECKDLNQIITKMSEYGNNFECIIKNIPIIYKINFKNRIDERNSILELCSCSSCQDYYLAELFRSAICRTIMCCKKAQNIDEINEYARAFARIIAQTNELFSNRDDEKEKIVYAIDEYCRVWRGKIKETALELIPLSSMLEEYRTEILDDTETNLGVCEQYRYNKLYDISKKILEISGVSISDFPELFFESAGYKHKEYDEIIRILDDVKCDQEKLSEIYNKLYHVFLYDVDISTEVIEELKNIVL